MNRTPQNIEETVTSLRQVIGDHRPEVLFAIGCGSGHLLDALAVMLPSTRAIVLEPDASAAERFIASRDWTPWLTSGRLTLLVGPDYAGASGIWRPVEWPSQDPPVIVDAATARRADAMTAAEAVIRRIVGDARANAEARKAHAGRYLLHTLANAPGIAREGNASALFNAFTGLPAIVVGAGPSLDGALAALDACRERAIIIACDTAARPLLSVGISPHFIIAVDPAEANALHLSALHNPRSSWLVAEGSVHPNGLSAFEGRTFIFNVSHHEPWPWFESLGLGRGRIAAWGSVATSAMDLAIQMGCTSIYFAGLDFAFTGGRPYCRGTTFEPQWAVWMTAGQDLTSISRALIDRWPVSLEAGADGRMVRTAPHLIAFRNWIRQRIEMTPGVNFMNATPGGILHHPRIATTTFEEAARTLPVIGSRRLELHIRSLHRTDEAAADRLFASIDELLAQETSNPAAGPRAAWAAFAAGMVRQDMISASLKSREYRAWSAGRASALQSGSFTTAATLTGLTAR